MTSNVIPIRQPDRIPTSRVAPIEAKWLHQTEIDAADIKRDWYRGANAMRAQINALDEGIRDTLEQYLSVRREHRSRGFEDFRPKFPAWLYWPILGIAALLETPLNNSALAFLGMDDTETLMVALSIALLNVLGASFAGWKIRQASWSKSAFREWLMVVAVVAVSISVMFGLAGLRMDDLTSKAQEIGVPVSSATFATFVTLQLLFFIVGTSITYSMHPADPNFERLLKQLRTLRSEGESLLRKRAAIAARHDRELGIAMSAVGKTRAECLAKIAEYRDYNFAARRVGAPDWMRHYISDAAFKPFQLGGPLDPQPATFEELLHRTLV